MSTCRDCHAPIRFVELDTRKAIPVDPQPSSDGNVAIQQLSRHKWFGYVTSKAKPLRPGFTLHRPHHASCKPNEARVAYADRTPALFETGPAT
jgi:hypothetical protein